jgi:hypothetical protein
MTDSDVREPVGALLRSDVAVIAPHIETTGLMFRITGAWKATSRSRT